MRKQRNDDLAFDDKDISTIKKNNKKNGGKNNKKKGDNDSFN